MKCVQCKSQKCEEMCSRIKEVSYQERITCTEISMLFPSIVNYIRMHNIESITFLNNDGSRTICQNQNCQKNLFSNKKRKCFNLFYLGDISKIRNENLISNKCIASSSITPKVIMLPTKTKKIKLAKKKSIEFQQKIDCVNNIDITNKDIIVGENVFLDSHNEDLDLDINNLFENIDDVIHFDSNFGNTLNIEDINNECIDLLCYEKLNDNL